MKSTRVYLIVLLALALISTGVLAWRQHLELITFRGPTGTGGKDSAALEKRVWEAEQKVRELEAELAAAKEANPDAIVAQNGNAAGGRGGPNAQGGRGGALTQQQIQAQQRALQQVMQQPAYQNAQAVAQKAQLDQRYAGLVRNLGLPADQASNLSAALLARNTAETDAATAARAAGLDPRTPEYQQFLDQALSQANDGVRTVIGDAGLLALQQYDQTMPQRNTVNQFQQQLVQYGSGALLTDAQSEQLVSLLSASAQRQGGGRAGPAADNLVAGNFTFTAAAGPGGVVAFGGGRGGGGGGLQVSPTVLAQAAQILTPVQYQALQQMQAAQAAQQTMQQLTVNATRGATAPTGGQQQGGARTGTTTQGGATRPAGGGGGARGGG